MKRLLMCWCAALVAIASTANAQNVCDAVLAQHLVDDTLSINETDRMTALQAGERANYFRSSSSSGSGAGGYKGFELSGNAARAASSGGASEKSFARSDAESSFVYYAAKALRTGDAIKSWERCMTNRRGLSCWAVPQSDPKVFMLKIHWMSPAKELPIVSSSAVVQGKTRDAAVPPGELLKKGEKVAQGERSFLLERTNSSEYVQVLLNVLQDERENFTCVLTAPPEAPTANAAAISSSQVVDPGKMVVRTPRGFEIVVVRECGALLERLPEVHAQLINVPPIVTTCVSRELDSPYNPKPPPKFPTAECKRLSTEASKKVEPISSHFSRTRARLSQFRALSQHIDQLPRVGGIACPAYLMNPAMPMLPGMPLR